MCGCLDKRVLILGMLTAIVGLLVPSGISCTKPSAPIADFTYSYVSGDLLSQEEDYISGTAPFVVRFTDQSTGKITSWRWSFGDGPAVQGGEENKSVTHTYETPNSSGYTVVLTVQGPGGKDDETKEAIIGVLRCSEAANAELNFARGAITGCLEAAGKTQLDSYDSAWDGSRGKVTAGGKDAADYLGVWNKFKATYAVEPDGSISSGNDVDWHCVVWSTTGLLGKAGWMMV